MKNLWVSLCAIFLVLSFSQIAYSVPYTHKEIKDAGELIDTAQITRGKGRLDYISGDLKGYNDIDMYQIYINNPDVFSVTVEADLSVDNDAMLWLFDFDGYLVMSDDDGGYGFLPQFNPGEMSGKDTGSYFLAIDLYMTEPIGDPLTGWTSAPSPQQEGPYILSLTGASPVPEPTTMLLLGSGLIFFAWIAREKTF